MNYENKVVIGFAVIVGLLGLFIIVKTFPRIHFRMPVEMTLIKQNGSINSITNQRNPSYTQHYKVPTIYFPEGTDFEHPSIGPFGLKQDFFADFDAKMDVKKDGTYFFHVASDDGFQLFIDNKLVGEFLTDRPFTTNQMNIYLSSGEHTYHLSYYQGFGRLGLIAFYQFFGDSGTYLIGKNSSYLDFK